MDITLTILNILANFLYYNPCIVLAIFFLNTFHFKSYILMGTKIKHVLMYVD
jgi:hypothetical protein